MVQKVVPVQYPLATGPNFNSLIDVLLMKKYSWGPEGGAPTIEDVPAEEMERQPPCIKHWWKLLPNTMKPFMENSSNRILLTEDEMREGIRKVGLPRMFPYSAYVRARIWVRRLMEFLGNVVSVCRRNASGAQYAVKL